MPERAIPSRTIVKYLTPNMVSGNTYIKDKTSQENDAVWVVEIFKWTKDFELILIMSYCFGDIKIYLMSAGELFMPDKLKGVR